MFEDFYSGLDPARTGLWSQDEHVGNVRDVLRFAFGGDLGEFSFKMSIFTRNSHMVSPLLPLIKNTRNVCHFRCISHKIIT